MANVRSCIDFTRIMKTDSPTTVSPHTQDRLSFGIPARLSRTPVTSRDLLSGSPVPFLGVRHWVYRLFDSQVNESIMSTFRQIFVQELLLNHGDATLIVRREKTAKRPVV